MSSTSGSVSGVSGVIGVTLPRLGVDIDSDDEFPDRVGGPRLTSPGFPASAAYAFHPSASHAHGTGILGGTGASGAPGHDEMDALAEFPTYEDYLDSQIIPEDMKYLESEELMRQLVELGYRGSGEALKRFVFMHSCICDSLFCVRLCLL